jgi:hypothetical protein
MKKLLLIILMAVLLLSTCSIHIGNEEPSIGRAYIVNSDGKKIGETSAIYLISNGGIFVLVNKDFTLYKFKEMD